MKNIYLLFTVLMTSAVFSCCTTNKTNREELSTVNVSLSENRETIVLNDIASKVKYVSLETHDSLLIGEIADVVKKDRHYFISDGKVLYKFNADGKLAGQISKKGKGPYNEISRYANISAT